MLGSAATAARVKTCRRHVCTRIEFQWPHVFIRGAPWAAVFGYCGGAVLIHWERHVVDARYRKLAELLVNFSTRVKPGENVLIEAFEIPDEMVVELVRATRRAGGLAHVAERSMRVMRSLIDGASEASLTAWAESDLFRMKQMQVYLGLRGSFNASEYAGISDDQMKKYAKLYGKRVHLEQRVNHTKWCVLRWPTPSMAQAAQMSTESFEDFYFDVCTMNYGAMDKAAAALTARMQRTDRVRLKGPGETDLTFSIKGIPAIRCCGDKNIPDGECFTAPVKDSVNGVIHFNAPTIYNGTSFEDVRLEFSQGRITNATASLNQEQLRSILDTDEGAKYVGEFAIGFNPFILKPMKDILFDEKIAGSIHFTPGNAYEEADNGNRSEIHWDMVLIQRPEHGGGVIEFDGEVIRRDGLFVAPDLVGLNPDALMRA
jgi:aminopeptidase